MMKKLLLVLLLVLFGLAGYVAAGPWLTVRAIREALRGHDARALAAQVDFPALRRNLEAQMEDRLARATGTDWQANAFGRAGLALAHGVLETTVDAMVSPSGLAAMMEGRAVWKRLLGASGAGEEAEATPLDGAHYRYESPSTFTATVTDVGGAPIVFVFQRVGLRWKLVGIELPQTP